MLHLGNQKLSGFVGFFGAVVLINTLLAGCLDVQSSRRLERLSKLFILETDLPPGWEKTNEGEEFLHNDVTRGIISHFVSFSRLSESANVMAYVLQTLVDYPTSRQAAQAVLV